MEGGHRTTLRILVCGTVTVIIGTVIYSGAFYKTSTPKAATSYGVAVSSRTTINSNVTGILEIGGTRVHGSVCEVPMGGFKGWRDGVVTVVKPQIGRNCTKIFAGDQQEIKRIKGKSWKWKNALKDGELQKMIGNCTWVSEYFHDNLYTTKLERSFPIAYTFVVYESPQQVMRLLKFLYRPTNIYCIHPDKKSELMFNFFNKLAACLKNVILPSKVVKVSWGHFSLMEAQMNCLSDLMDWRSKQPEHKKWKYVINLCGKEVPLVSTRTTISSLSKLKGTSSIIANRATDRESRRRLRGMTLPHKFLLYKSMTYVALSYKFAFFLLTNSTAIELHNFFKKCSIPEEHFYATVYMIPGVPGGFNASMKKLYFHVSTYIWLFNRKHRPHCSGKRVHQICIVTVGDLKQVAGKKDALFHNKYFMEHDHTIMDCMEERLVEKNRLEYQEDCS